jgi:hypothetical protein
LKLSTLCQNGEITDEIADLHKEFMTELNGLFKITLEVFTRTKFVNLEQEKTKSRKFKRIYINNRWQNGAGKSSSTVSIFY